MVPPVRSGVRWGAGVIPARDRDDAPSTVAYARPDGPHYQPATDIGPAFSYWRVLLPNGVAVGRIRSESEAWRLVKLSQRPGVTLGEMRRAWAESERSTK